MGGLESTPRAASYLARVPSRSLGHLNSYAVGLRRVLLHLYPALPASPPPPRPLPSPLCGPARVEGPGRGATSWIPPELSPGPRKAGGGGTRGIREAPLGKEMGTWGHRGV